MISCVLQFKLTKCSFLSCNAEAISFNSKL